MAASRHTSSHPPLALNPLQMPAYSAPSSHNSPRGLSQILLEYLTQPVHSNRGALDALAVCGVCVSELVGPGKVLNQEAVGTVGAMENWLVATGNMSRLVVIRGALRCPVER